MGAHQSRKANWVRRWAPVIWRRRVRLRQDPVRLAKFIQTYQNVQEMPEKDSTPYFYGSHYSTAGSVLHYLLRLEPFTQCFVEFQGGRFDIPDRAFHSIQQTWYLSSSYSTTDVKEVRGPILNRGAFLCWAHSIVRLTQPP